MQSAAGPGQPVISSCQREAESTRNLGGMRRGRGGQPAWWGEAKDLASSVSITNVVHLITAESEAVSPLGFLIASDSISYQ